jgi:IclR family KDG regulon transcriptional repressor
MSVTDNFVPSVHSSLRVLELLAREEYEKCTLSEIADTLSISKSTCLRILKTLQNRQFVQFDQIGKRYSLGPSLIFLGDRAREINDVLSIALSYLPKACKIIDYTIVLSKLLNENEFMYIAKEEPKKSIRLTISVGETFPLTAAAIGKCFMAFQADEKRNKVIKKFAIAGKLPRVTKNSITEIDVFLESLQTIRESQIAISNEEYSPGVTAVASPVFNSEGTVEFVLSTLISTSIVNEVNLEVIGNEIKKIANEITEAIANFP